MKFQDIVKIVETLVNLFINMSQKGSNPTSSSSAGSVTYTISNLSQSPKILVKRSEKTTDGVFGVMTLSWDASWSAETCENRDLIVQAGTYPVLFRISPEFGFKVPWIQVPGRTFIECHPANLPTQLKGCVAVGTVKDGDAIDNSGLKFKQLMDSIATIDATNLTIEYIDMD